MERNLQKQMVFKEKLNKLLEETSKWRRLRRKSPSIMILSLEKIVNLRSIILCFR
jgi:hypothetical protein